MENKKPQQVEADDKKSVDSLNDKPLYIPPGIQQKKVEKGIARKDSTEDLNNPRSFVGNHLNKSDLLSVYSNELEKPMIHQFGYDAPVQSRPF